MLKTLILMLLLLVVSSNAQNNIDLIDNCKLEITEFNSQIKLGLSNLTKDIPDDYIENYGFYSKSEIENAEIGDAIPVFSAKGNELIFTSTWRIPIIVGGNYRALLTVELSDKNEYKIVDFGAHVLAQEIQKKSQGYPFLGLLRSFKIQSDFVIVKDKEEGLEYIRVKSEEVNLLTFEEVLELIGANQDEN